MYTRCILLGFFSFGVWSCKDKSKKTGAVFFHVDSANASLEKAREDGIKVEGRFVQIKKINDRYYDLYLRVSVDSIALFKTQMPLDSNEISLLKKEGNNIRITNKEYNDPATMSRYRMIRYMVPVYDSR